MNARVRRTLRVLVVDDDRRVLTALTHLLRAEGLHVTPADSPEAARSRLDQSPDVALVDTRLPHVSEWTLTALGRNAGTLIQVGGSPKGQYLDFW